MDEGDTSVRRTAAGSRDHRRTSPRSTRPAAGGVHPRAVAVAEQLGPLGAVFAEAGYAPITPGWPDDPETVEEANAHPEVFANKTVGQVAEHYAEVIGGWSEAGRGRALVRRSPDPDARRRGLSAASVAIDPAPFRGVLPLPISALRSAKPVLGNPANRHRAVPLTYDQFRYAFANAVARTRQSSSTRVRRARAGRTAVPGRRGEPQPVDEAKVDTKNPDRGPLLIMSGERDHTVPPASPRPPTRSSCATRA